jgi:hypothetical protein
LDKVAEVMLQVGKLPWEQTKWFLNVLKCDFGDVDEAMFLYIERLQERIFYILGIKKSDLYEVADVKF